MPLLFPFVLVILVNYWDMVVLAKAVLSNLFSELSYISAACGSGVVREVRERAKCWESGRLSSSCNSATIVFYSWELGHVTPISRSIFHLFVICQMKISIVALLASCCSSEAIDGEQMCKINSALQMIIVLTMIINIYE